MSETNTTTTKSYLDFTFTDTIKNAINSIAHITNNSSNNKKEKELIERIKTLKTKYTTNKTQFISYKDIKEISNISKEINKEISNNTTTVFYIQDLLKGSVIYIPPKPTPKIDPELEAKRQQYEKLAKDQEYARLVKNIVPKKDERNELNSISSQVSIGVNILITFFTLLAGGMYLGNRMFSSMLMGLAFGLGAGIFGVAVEVWLFVIRTSGTQLQKDKEQRDIDRAREIDVKRREFRIKKSHGLLPASPASKGKGGGDKEMVVVK
ncbi:hypothetical protein CYY_008754 [Polysphondylium violaceum]|uniref:Endoplasmic reticulum-based factor for assembly of V-ATPase n=1 Tax=Polysphondylium violaceum TaxID=133409 RepID=A0A8J4PL38_9MYCE|nr:hypothetical protein CYY_008754 [Polysphondylium violaceum]